MRAKLLFFLVCLAAIAPQVMATNSVETRFTWGRDYLGYQASGSVDLDQAGNWNGFVSFHKGQFTDPENTGWDHLYYLEGNHFATETLILSGYFSSFLDSEKTSALGPGFSLFYTYFAPEPGAAAENAPARVEDVFTVGFDGQVLFYQADLESSDFQSGVTVTASNKTRITQASPTLFLDVALIPGWLNANASGSYFIYSGDPAQIAAGADPALTTLGISALSSLMAGLSWASWQTGMVVTLPCSLNFAVEYGRQQQVYPAEWVANIDLSLSGRISPWLKAKINWKRYYADAENDDLYTAGLKFDF